MSETSLILFCSHGSSLKLSNGLDKRMNYLTKKVNQRIVKTKYERKTERVTNDDTEQNILENIVRLTLRRNAILKERSSVLELVFMQPVHLI